MGVLAPHLYTLDRVTHPPLTQEEIFQRNQPLNIGSPDSPPNISELEVKGNVRIIYKGAILFSWLLRTAGKILEPYD